MLLFPKRDDDNTPQGKLAYGCMCMIWFVIAGALFVGASQAILETIIGPRP